MRAIFAPRLTGFTLQAPTAPPVTERFQFDVDGIAVEANAALSVARAPETVSRDQIEQDSCAPPLPEEPETAASLRTMTRRHRCASLKPLGQIRDSFILAVNHEGLWIIDQHVAHERVLFEKILKQRAAQKVESQRLLMPLVLELTPAQQAVFAEISDELQQNGFEAEPFGARSVAVKVAPAGVDAAQVEHMLHELLDQFSREEQALNWKRVRARIAASIACHAAIKVNMPLRAKQNGVAAGGTGENRLPNVLPARPAGGSAILDEGHSEGVQENLETTTASA